LQHSLREELDVVLLNWILENFKENFLKLYGSRTRV
jgi:hypothetical protein